MHKEKHTQQQVTENSNTLHYRPGGGRKLGIGRRLLFAGGVLVSSIATVSAVEADSWWPQTWNIGTPQGQIVSLRFTGTSSPPGAFICSGPRARVIPNSDGETYSIIIPTTFGAPPQLAQACKNAFEAGIVPGPWPAEIGQYALPSDPNVQRG